MITLRIFVRGFEELSIRVDPHDIEAWKRLERAISANWNDLHSLHRVSIFLDTGKVAEIITRDSILPPCLRATQTDSIEAP